MKHSFLPLGSWLALATLWLVGCNTNTPPSTPRPTPPALVDLQFEDADIGARVHELDACIREQVLDAAWVEIPYRRIGNFYQTSWCRGIGSRADCQVTDTVLRGRDVHTLSLATLAYPQSPADAFGLIFNATWLPPDEGWGVNVGFSEGGRNIVGSGVRLNFYQYVTATGDASAYLNLGDSFSYPLYETTIRHEMGLTPLDAFAQYLVSPENLRDVGLANLNALAEKVYTALNSHSIQACEYGEYEGDGIPPDCMLRPLTSAEEAQALTEAQNHFAQQTQLLTDEYQTLYTSLLTAFPFDACWR